MPHGGFGDVAVAVAAGFTVIIGGVNGVVVSGFSIFEARCGGIEAVEVGVTPVVSCGGARTAVPAVVSAACSGRSTSDTGRDKIPFACEVRQMYTERRRRKLQMYTEKRRRELLPVVLVGGVCSWCVLLLRAAVAIRSNSSLGRRHGSPRLLTLPADSTPVTTKTSKY